MNDGTDLVAGYTRQNGFKKARLVPNVLSKKTTGNANIVDPSVFSQQ